MKKVHDLAKNRRKRKVRAKINGLSDKPRISVFRSNRYTYVQAIVDIENKTILSGSTESYTKDKSTKSEKAMKLGEEFGKKIIDMKVSKCVFDRGQYKYHGRVKSLAEGMRKAGLQF